MIHLHWVGGSICFSLCCITFFQPLAGIKMQHQVVIILVCFSLSDRVKSSPYFLIWHPFKSGCLWMYLNNLFQTHSCFGLQEKAASCPVSPLPFRFPSHGLWGLGRCFVRSDCVPAAMENSHAATTLEEMGENSTAEKEFSLYPNICFFWGVGIILAVCTRERWKSEKISMFSKRKLFLFFPALCLNYTVIFCCWKVALLHRQTFSSVSQA